MPDSSCPRIELAPGYRVARVINGCWQLAMGHGGNHQDEPALLARFDRLVDAGFTTFDCADIYTGVEALLGRFLARSSNRDRVQVHTKYVPDLQSLGSLDRHAIARAIDRSLSRLGVARLDLVQFHWWDFTIPGFLDALAVLDELRGEGKIRLLGLTNFDTPRLQETIDAGFPVRALQLQYSLLDRRALNGIAALCRSQAIGMLAYGSLAGGLLGSAPGTMRSDNRSHTKYRLIVDEIGGPPALDRLNACLAMIAAKHRCTASSVAARWVLDQPGIAAIILGLGDRDRVKDNLALASLDLDEEDRAALDALLKGQAVPPGDVFGLERDFSGVHAANMKMNLNRGGES